VNVKHSVDFVSMTIEQLLNGIEERSIPSDANVECSTDGGVEIWWFD
jgi:hypothetical protein